MKLFLSLLILIFSLLGIADAGYISYSQAMGIIPPCSSNFRCETVLLSEWSKIGPVPLSVMGVLFYSTFLVLGILNYFEVRDIGFRSYRLPLRYILVAWGSFGLLFSLYLVVIMGVVIKAWCFYCLLSALNCSLLCLLSWGLFKQPQGKTA